MNRKQIAKELLKIASRVVESLVYDYDDLKKDKKLRERLYKNGTKPIGAIIVGLI